MGLMGNNLFPIIPKLVFRTQMERPGLGKNASLNKINLN
jgi:hypothetical protein